MTATIQPRRNGRFTSNSGRVPTAIHPEKLVAQAECDIFRQMELAAQARNRQGVARPIPQMATSYSEVTYPDPVAVAQNPQMTKDRYVAVVKEATDRTDRQRVRRVITNPDEQDFALQPMFIKFRMNDPVEFNAEGTWSGQHIVLDVNHLSEQARGWINSGKLIMDEWDMDLYNHTKLALEMLDPFFVDMVDEAKPAGPSEEIIRDAAKAMAATLLGYGLGQVKWAAMSQTDSSDGEEDQIEIKFTIRRKAPESTERLVNQIAQESFTPNPVTDDMRETFNQHLNKSRSLRGTGLGHRNPQGGR